MSAHDSDLSLSGRTTHGISAAATLVSGEGREAPSPKLGDRLGRGAMVGRYIVLDLLGRGGMGVVYTAYDPELDRKVALKLLLPGRDRRPGARLRLQREAQAIARLSHPNVVAVHDVGAVDDQVFIAMEFVDGTDLAHWLHATPREPAQVLTTYLQAGEGLAAAHAAGLAHRDFKPENVLLGTDGRARVVDFGLVREDENMASRGGEDPEMLDVSQRRLEGSDIRLTDAGTLVGTPAYMSPEQFMGEGGDARSDQFSFCVALYEGLYGERPFAGEDVAELSMSVLDGEIRAPPAASRVAGRLRRVLLRGLAYAPPDRYPGMPALLAALRKASAPRRRWWIVPAALGLGGIGAVAVASQRSAEEVVRCDGGEAQWHRIWGPAQQAELEEVFVGTGLPYARDTWGRVQARVDQRLGLWVEQDQQLCEQTATLGPAAMAQDPRRHCLNDRLAETADLLAVFGQAQSTTVTGAIPMLHGLHAVECMRADAIDAPPTPSDPALAESVEQLRSELRRWHLQSRAANASAETLQPLAERAAALGYEPLDAEVLFMQASAVGEEGRLDDALELSNRAFETALGCRHDVLAFEAATNLMFMHGLMRREFEPGHRWGRRAQALERRLGDDPTRHLRLHSNWAAVHTIHHDQEKARHHYDEALSTVRTMDDPTNLATVLNNIGSFHAQHGRLTVGLDYLQEASALNEDLFGPDHPTTLRTTANLGIVAVMDGQLEDGLAQLELILPRQEAVLGPEHGDLLPSLEGMATAFTRLARYEEAMATRQRAAMMRRQHHGPTHPLTLAAQSDLASAMIRAGEYERAWPLLREIEPHVAALGPREHDLQVRVLNFLGITLAQRAEPGAEPQDQLTRSNDYARRALALCESTDQCKPALRVEVLDTVGWGALRSGDQSEAQASFSRIVDEDDATRPSWLWLSARRGLVFVRFAEDRQAALSLARQTLDDPRSTNGPRVDPRAREQVRALTRWLDDPHPFEALDAEG